MDDTRKVRLQKIISQAGIASRRAAEKLIAEGRVTINGETVREMGTKAVKPHGPHAAPKGTHFTTADAPSVKVKAGKDEDFGTGIM